MLKGNKIEIEISAATAGLRKGLNDAARGINLLGKELKSSLTTAAGQQVNSLVTGFKGVGLAAAAAATGGLYLFVSGMREAINQSLKIQSIERAMIAISGSSKLAADEMKFLQTESKRLGLEMVSVADAYTGLFAASKGTVLEGEKTRKIFSAISEAGVALGMSTDKVKGSLLAVSQMMSKGKVSAEELRGQLGERLPGAFNLMAKSMGVSTQQLDKMLQKGDVGVDVLVNFAKVIHETYGQAAESTDSYAKAMGNLSNAYSQFQAEAGGLVTNNSFVIESLKIITKVFEELQKSIADNRNELVGWVKTGVLTMIDGVGMAIEAMRFFYNGWQGISLAAHGAVIIVTKGMALAAQGINFALTPLSLFLTALEKIGVIDSNPLKDFAETMKGVSNVSVDDFNELLKKIESTNGKFDGAEQAVEDFRKKIADIPAEYKDTAAQMKDDSKEVGQEIMKVGGVWVNVGQEAIDASAKAKAKMIQDINDIRDAIKSVPKIDYGSGSAPSGYKTGGDPFFGGLGGYGGGDRRVIMVEDGEHVIRKEAVAKMGHGFFQRFNSLNFPKLPKFATGGPVGAMGGGSGETVNINLSLPGGSAPVRMSADRTNAAELMRQLQRMQRLAS